MKYLAAYALLALGGKKDITAADLKTLLSSVQSHASDAEINQVISALKGKSLHQLIAEGQGRLGSSAPSAGKVADKKDAKKEEPKKEAKKQQPKKKEEAPPAPQEEDADLGDLFG